MIGGLAIALPVGRLDGIFNANSLSMIIVFMTGSAIYGPL
jgi:hypothetical protein